MVNYTCFRCGYTNKIKSNFIKHLNRKFTCEPKLNDISIDKIYENLAEGNVISSDISDEMINILGVFTSISYDHMRLF